MNTRAYHHGNVRSALMQRALESLETHGIEGLSLRQLAKDIGVSHGAPSRHFADKQALLDALAIDGFTTMKGVIDGAAGISSSFRERFAATAHAYIDFAVANPALLTTMFAIKHGPDASEALRSLGSATMDAPVALIRQAQATGEVGPGDPVILATVVFAGINGVATLATNDLLDGVPVEVVTAQTIDVLWAGLTTTP